MADGKLLGIEGTPQARVETLGGARRRRLARGDGGHPEVTCTKGQFQGFNVWLDAARGGAEVPWGCRSGGITRWPKPLPAPGTAEI